MVFVRLRCACISDENCDIEGVERMTYEDTIRYIKENNLYDKTMSKLNAENVDDILYKILLE